MKEYISTIIYVAIFSIILELILPSNKLKKYITGLMGLLVVIVIASPVLNFLKDGDVILALSTAIENIGVTEDTYATYDFSKQRDKMISSSVKERLEDTIYESCVNKFPGFNVKGVNIEIDEEYKVKEINAVVKNIDTVEDARQIINHITETYNVQEQVINIVKGE